MRKNELEAKLNLIGDSFGFGEVDEICDNIYDAKKYLRRKKWIDVLGSETAKEIWNLLDKSYNSLKPYRKK